MLHMFRGWRSTVRLIGFLMPIFLVIAALVTGFGNAVGPAVLLEEFSRPLIPRILQFLEVQLLHTEDQDGLTQKVV